MEKHDAVGRIQSEVSAPHELLHLNAFKHFVVKLIEQATIRLWLATLNDGYERRQRFCQKWQPEIHVLVYFQKQTKQMIKFI